MQPIKILQVFTTLNRGGAETNFMNYVRQMDLKQFKFEVVVHREAIGAYEQELQNMGIPIHRLPAITPLNYWRYKKAARTLLVNGQYDIVHSHISELSIWILKTAKQLHVPVRIVHAHLSSVNIDLKWPIRLYWRSQLRKFANIGFTCSDAASKWLFTNPLQWGEIQLMRNAVNTSEWQFDLERGNQIRDQFGIAHSINWVHVGRFDTQKNHKFLIHLFKQFNNVQSNSNLFLLGDGNLANDIKSQIKALNLEGKVHCVGTVNNVSDFLQAMDIMVFPSLFEGLPVSIIEAQASGLPCVLSDTISQEVVLLPDYVQFVSIDAPQDQWLMAINKALALPRKNQSEAITAAGYDIQRNAKQLEAYYAKCVSKANG
jgi:glycosyltransferase involved in cell wall biosynthesis